MRSLIIGLGEIGKAVKEVLEEHHTVRTLDIEGEDTTFKGEAIWFMHICFPYTQDFTNQVIAYKDKFQPKHVVIWSTVPIGTSKALKAAHSPVEGRHPHLAESIKKGVRWFGCDDKQDRYALSRYFSETGFSVREVESSDFTEALKLISTAEYGVNIVFATYKKQIADDIGMDYSLTKDWNVDYNELYQVLGMPQFQKYLLDAPDGPIGGHCIVPNAKLLDKQFPSPFLKMIGKQS